MAGNQELLIVRLDRVIPLLRRVLSHPDLVHTNLDSILKDLIDTLEKPSALTGKSLDDAVLYALSSQGLTGTHVDEEIYDACKNTFAVCLIYLRDMFQELRPYHDGRLTYRFKERRGQQSVILQRYPR